MSSSASLNAFRGYSYQQQIFSLFLIQMDAKRFIKRIKAENFVDGHNFDDIFLETQDGDIFIQIKNKNITGDKFKIEKDNINLNGEKINFNSQLTNLLIVKNINLNINCELLGLPCYRENNIYICSIDSDRIFNYIETLNINDERLVKLIFLSDKICANGCEIKVENLPPFLFFNNELLDKTIKTRNKCLEFEKNKLNIIIGKPGVGKSHFVNELEIENSILYRFWINENDPDKKNRLQYNNFLEKLSLKLYNGSQIRKEEEIITELINKQKILIIDGLDHVENYNNLEMAKYFNFFELLKNNSIRTIILTRPLQRKLEGNIFELDNWNRSQTFDFIEKKYGKMDYETLEKIFNYSKGYPIIVDFICKDYITNKVIKPLPEINNLNQYYDALISESDIRGLYIFSKCKCYLKDYEIENILGGYSYSMFSEFVKRNKFLFNSILDRLTLIHDSLNLYIRKKLPVYKELDDKIYNYAFNSIKNKEIRFLSRFQSFDFILEDKLLLIKKYLSIDTFAELASKNFDYESLQFFYKNLPYEMTYYNLKEYSTMQYYELTLIQSIIARNNIEQTFEVLIPLINYIRVKKPNSINFEIFSSETIFMLMNSDISYYEKYMANSFYDVNSVINSLKEEQEKYTSFFELYNGKINHDAFEKIDFKRAGGYYGTRMLAKLFCNLYLNKDNYLNSIKFVRDCAYDNYDCYSYAYELLKKFNMETSNMDINSLIIGIKDLIFQYGKFKEINYYENSTLKDIIKKFAHRANNFETSRIKSKRTLFIF